MILDCLISISPPCGFSEQLKSLVWCDFGCYELCLWPALQGICWSRHVQFTKSLVLVQKHALHSLSAKGNPAFTCCAHLSFWSLHRRLILQSLYLLPSSPLFFPLLSLHPITPQTFTSSPPSATIPLWLWILLFFSASLLFSPLLHLNQECSKFYEFIKMIMDSPGRHAGRQQGETMAVGTDGEKGKEEKSEGGVVALLNFNEYQGEFVLHIFFLLLFHFFPGIHTSTTWLKITITQMSFNTSGFGLDSSSMSLSGAIDYTPRKQPPKVLIELPICHVYLYRLPAATKPHMRRPPHPLPGNQCRCKQCFFPWQICCSLVNYSFFSLESSR